MADSLPALIALISDAKSIVLSTHRQCDGDGLGAQLGLYHALKLIGKEVRVLNVDQTPKKYHFLRPDAYIQCFESPHSPLGKTDLALILDTNDRRLLEPLYFEFERMCKHIVFIDHHPRLRNGPAPTEQSFIDPNAASTGEIAFQIIKALNIELNKDIAKAIYTSIVFDTQLFRYVRNSPTSHLIAAELLKHEKSPDEVHRFLFANHSIAKIQFLSRAMEKIEYHLDGKIAILRLEKEDLQKHNMSTEDSRDLIDFVMNIDTLIVGVMLRQEAPQEYKLSFRSKGLIEVRTIAESFGGGGHLYAAGATVRSSYQEIRNSVITGLTELIKKSFNEQKTQF